jgi:uncharacterized membrane protein
MRYESEYITLLPPDTPGPDIPQRFLNFIRGRVLAGLLFLAPFVLTYMVLGWLYSLAADMLHPVLENWMGGLATWAAIAILAAIPLGIGVLAYGPGRHLLHTIETIGMSIPVIGSIFVVARQLVASFDSATNIGFSRVVEIEYPRKGMWSIGFLTSIVEHEDGERMGVVYVPTAPTPTSGMTVVVPLADVFDLNMSAADAMTYTVSAGVTTPAVLRRTVPAEVEARKPSSALDDALAADGSVPAGGAPLHRSQLQAGVDGVSDRGRVRPRVQT